MVAAPAATMLRRPEDSVWIWIATGLAVLGILSEPTVRTLLRQDEVRWPPSCPGCGRCRSRRSTRSLVAMAPLAQALLGGLLAAFGAPGWCYLLVVVVSLVPMLILTGTWSGPM